MRILLTGFEAFAGNSSNPTEDLVLSLRGREEIKTLVLPVSFEHAWKHLKKEIEIFKPQWVISCGVAAKRETIDLERVALNFIDASIVDNDGKLLGPRMISHDHPPCYINELPLNQLRKELSSKSPVNVSLSAGSYVCNYLYFQAMAHREQYQYQSLFIHFPYTNDRLTLDSFKDFMNELLAKLGSLTVESI